MDLIVSPEDAEHAEELAARLTLSPRATPPGQPQWTAQDVINIALERGLSLLAEQYPEEP